MLVNLLGARDGFGHAHHVAHGRDIVNPHRIRTIDDRRGHSRGCAENPLDRGPDSSRGEPAGFAGGGPSREGLGTL